MKDNKTAKTNHRFSREGVKTETRSEVAGDFRIKLNLAHNHRGVEKLYESMHLNQGVFISERISAHSSVSSSFAFILAIEEVSNLNIPKRAEYIRIIASELERIRAHLYCLVLLGSETGSGMLRSEAERRLIEILSLFEKLFGNRYHSALMRIGGVNIDITFEDGYILRDFLDKILR
ncbi:MAG: hypothetical protein GX817_06590, partial [Elusimicrobia bacterium]|nr:hypothetical protein [Elusimicrobiota bacterium]